MEAVYSAKQVEINCERNICMPSFIILFIPWWFFFQDCIVIKLHDHSQIFEVLDKILHKTMMPHGSFRCPCSARLPLLSAFTFMDLVVST